MFSKFVASIIANMSEKMLLDFFAAIVRELTLNKNIDGLEKAVDHLQTIIKETKQSELSDEEKNALLVPAGRDVVDRLRKR